MNREIIGNPDIIDFMARDRLGLLGDKNEFKQHARQFAGWMESIPVERLDLSYAANKWTLRALLGHIIDSHVVVLYRILSISRGDKNPLPGGNQDLWASFPGYDKACINDLVQGYGKAANLTGWLMDWIPEKAMENRGTANGVSISVRELCVYLIAHERHHRRVAMEKYGV